MADIREHYEGQGDNSFLRARSSERMADKIATEQRSQFLAKESEQEAEALNIPVWLLEAQKAIEATPSYKPAIKLMVKGNGDLYYKDSLGCKIELPREAKSIPHTDGMLLSELVNI